MPSFARAVGATVFGVRADLVDVQASLTAAEEGGRPTVFRIVGLPDSALREGRERIRGAAAHDGCAWPRAHVTVNLAPAADRKEGAALDLPIALAVLGAAGVIPEQRTLRAWLALGELGLDGSIRGVRGVLACVEAARRRGVTKALVPQENSTEAAAVAGVDVVAVPSLSAAVAHLSGTAPLDAVPPSPWAPHDAEVASPVRGQAAAVRAAIVAAAGGHNLLLWGPPGAGKTLLARQIVAWLPAPTYAEALEASRVHSVAGLLDGGLLRARPFRAPHHTTSVAGLVGGGSIPRPGEVSLAHLGVLFLDELAEFTRPGLEALRQPLEDGRIVIGRVAGRATFPTEVLLVGATNPCPCGWYGEGDRCRCSRSDVKRYRARLSGPLRDRFDLEVRVRPVSAEALVSPDVAADGSEPQARERARRRQAARARRLGLPRAWNARIPAALLPGAVEPTREAGARLIDQARRLGLTGRGVHRVLRVSRTLADLEGVREVEPRHVLEALAWRGG